MAGMQRDTPPPALVGLGARWGLGRRSMAILLALLYFTAIGGTRAGTYHFPLVAFSHLLILGLLAWWAVRSLARGRWLPRTPLDLPILAFYLLNVVSTLLSVNPRVSVENLAHLTIIILVYYIVVDALLSGWTMLDYVRPMLLVAGVLILVAIAELVVWLGIWAVGTGEVSPLLTLGEYRRRLVMGPANVLAWYIVLLLPLILAQLLNARSLRARMNLGALAICSGLVLASTLSRSGFIGMAVALATFALMAVVARTRRAPVSLRSYLRRPAIISIFLVAVLLAVVLLPAATNLFSARLYTVSIRFELWRAAARIISSRPLFGGGPGTFGYLFHQVPDSDPYAPDMYYNTAHNGLLNVAAESGLASSLVALWLIAAVVVTGWRYLRDTTAHTRYLQDIISACVAGIVGLMISTLFDVPWVFPLTTLYVVLFSAMIVTPYCSPRRIASLRLRWMTVAAFGLVAILLIWGDIAHFFQQRGVDALRNGRFEAAIADLQTSVAVDPFLSIYRFQLGVSKAYLGLASEDPALVSQAIQAYKEEISRGGDTPINNGNLAWLEWNVGDVDGALAHMQRASAQAPRDSYYKLGLGFFLEAAGDYEKAREMYSAAVAVTPSLIDSAFWQTSEYRGGFKADLQTSETISGLAGAWAAYFARDYEEAAGILNGLPETVSRLILQGKVETAQMQYTAAQETLDRAIAMSETNAQSYLARGQLHLASGDQSKALHDLRIAGQLGEKRADMVLGDIAYQSGDLEKAIALYQGSVPGCVALTGGYDYASQVYHRSNVTADFWPETITCAPYDSLVPHYLHLAEAYRAVGCTEEAEEVCHWLGDFYEPGYLEKLDLNDDRERACPMGTSLEREGHTAGFPQSAPRYAHGDLAHAYCSVAGGGQLPVDRCQESRG
jgi:tetratricopeptide (TPR) repeat protein/O-antigen ligase